jgi:hypothetical protein
MPDSSSNDPILEVLDAVESLRDAVTHLLKDLVPLPDTQLNFRQRAAIAVMEGLMGAEKGSFPFSVLHQDARERFALVAWGLADALLATERNPTSGHLGDRIHEREQQIKPPDAE